VTALAGSVAACGGSAGGDNSDNDGTGGDIVDGGEARLMIAQGIFSLDPAAVQVGNFGAQGGIMQALYDTLFYIDIASNELKPELGKSLEPASDACTEWKLQLQPNLEFTDGSPFDAEAVVYNWDRIKDPATASPQANNLAGVTATASDATTVDIKLDQQNCAFDRTVANSLGYIASPTALEQGGKDYSDAPVGAGPFVFDSWNKSANELVLKKNPDFFTEGLPHLDTITFATAGNQATVIDSIVSGQAQLANNVATPTAADDAEVAGLGIQVLAPSGGGAYQFNLKQAPFDEICARRAFAYALDPTAMDEALNQSTKVGGPMTNMMDESSPYHVDGIDFPSNDPELAAENVAECESKSNPIDFTITALSGSDQKTAEYVASRLNQVEGFDVKVEVITLQDAYTKIFVNRDYQVTSYPGGMKFHDPDPLFVNWLTSTGITNLTGYADPEMDSLVAAARSVLDENERIAAWNEVQKKWVEDIPDWMYSKGVSFFVFDPDLTGVEPVNGGLDILLTQKLGFTSEQ
jgi:peptide/nickel transport system substrate-binding protein